MFIIVIVVANIIFVKIPIKLNAERERVTNERI